MKILASLRKRKYIKKSVCKAKLDENETSLGSSFKFSFEHESRARFFEFWVDCDAFRMLFMLGGNSEIFLASEEPHSFLTADMNAATSLD